jgi:hypothetical protein
MKYDKMSDFEINLAVAKKLGLIIDHRQHSGLAVQVCDSEYHGWYTVNYCHDWSDIGPIIEKNKLWLQPDMIGDGYWHCYDLDDNHSAKGANPKRASAICFLMMQESK